MIGIRITIAGIGSSTVPMTRKNTTTSPRKIHLLSVANSTARANTCGTWSIAISQLITVETPMIIITAALSNTLSVNASMKRAKVSLR